jgi:16S rRNA G966 N2-methylase RsmD
MTDTFETNFRRLARTAGRLATFDFAPLAYAVWLRYHRLEFAAGNYVRPEEGKAHAHSGGPQLSRVIQGLQLTEESVALDLGAGMGIAALTLCRHFSQVIGVELSPELVAIAKRNVARMRVTNIELHCSDAREFSTGLDRVTHVYMFNPFPVPVMNAVLANLNRSLQRTPRSVTIIYRFPVCHDAVVAAGFVHRSDFHFRHSHPFSIYEA